MTIISLNQKRPQHQRLAKLRLSMQLMHKSLEQQKIAVAAFRSDVTELKEIVHEIKLNMGKFKRNLDGIEISRLGQESRKLAKIMARASA